ncbi:glycosyltransferase [Fulvivirga sediminis]|uniref:Glycosyltransferase n=1 Tax=Fulvivirga sediminis TaxID=2803949 RepID=A0A937F833_9BACT|nr:glycosyltransferase [Fulvivirga sediminis]MBL3658187.1 glycosyltransferase [Fulvivirga sediminis]
MKPGYNFENVGLLITHYNRSKSLERLLKSFKDYGVSFGQIVVSDDNSKQEHQNRINDLKNIYGFEYITTTQNKGLGNNINKGQDLIKTPYTLYVQEDFYPKDSFPEKLASTLQYMEDDNSLDVVRYYAYGAYPYLEDFKDGFATMSFKVLYPGYGKFFYYSDHPHLKRTSFFEKFGRYAEGRNPEQTEYRMMMSFLKNKGKGIFYKDHKSLFHHGNSEDEPSTMQRNSLRRSKNPVISFVRDIYRHVKFNFDYLF